MRYEPELTQKIPRREICWGSNINHKKRQGCKKRGGGNQVDSGQQFANQFPLQGSLAETIQRVESERIRAAEEREKRIVSQKMDQRHLNEQRRWDFAHRNLPHAPQCQPGYGTLHPMPYRPVIGQPPIQYPPGHTEAVLPPE